MPDYYIGRQAIFNKSKNVVAYELLYRSDNANVATISNPDLATSQVILNSYLETGISKLAGNHQTFINMTQHFIHHKELLPPPDNQLVLEIVEDIAVTEDLIAAITDLKQHGYKIALDDFRYDKSLIDLIELADIIKVDILDLSLIDIELEYNKLRAFDKTLLAEKVETHEQFEHCKALGFDLFQGFFLSKPRIVKGKRMPANHTGILYLLTQLLNENISTDELAELISNDVCISHKLLKYINSAANHKNVQIKSMHDAVIMCGMKTLKNWTMLIALSAIDNKPDALITYSLIRAKMCSILAKNTPGQEHESCFTIGLLSVIDAMMDQPLAEIMQSLPLASDLKDALLSHKGEKGNILKCTIAYEHADWDNAHYGSLSSEEMADVYIEAVNWAEINLLQLVA